jgi:hypothetical protein
VLNTAAETITVTGARVDEDTKTHLLTGWNGVGVADTITIPTDIAVSSPWLHYDTVTSSWVHTTGSLLPGVGYEVKVNRNTAFLQPATPLP